MVAPVVPALGKWQQEDQEKFRAIHGYIMSLRAT